MPVPPWPVRLLGRCPLLQRIPARLVGLGVRPEHVRAPPELAPPQAMTIVIAAMDHFQSDPGKANKEG